MQINQNKYQNPSFGMIDIGKTRKIFQKARLGDEFSRMEEPLKELGTKANLYFKFSSKCKSNLKGPGYDTEHIKLIAMPLNKKNIHNSLSRFFARLSGKDAVYVYDYDFDPYHSHPNFDTGDAVLEMTKNAVKKVNG